MDNGFGARMQFTATRTRSYDQFGTFVGSINAAPPTTWTIGVLYDKGPLSADLNWDSPSSYTGVLLPVHGRPRLAGDLRPLQLGDGERALALRQWLRGLLEGKNLSNSIARTYLNGNPLLPWAPGQNVGASESGVGYGYSAYGRTYLLGIAWQH